MKKIFYCLLTAFSFVIFFTKAGEIQAGATTQTFNYTVQQGETLYSVSQELQVGTPEIKELNPVLQTNSTLYAGQVLKIPDLSYQKSLEKEVIRLTNLERTKRGIPELTHYWELSRVARYKSEDMRDNNYFSHYSPTYGDPFIMMRDFGISFTKAGENIAGRQDTPEKVVANLMSSDSHRANILNPEFKRVGVGYAQGGYLGHYWTQMFITP